MKTTIFFVIILFTVMSLDLLGQTSSRVKGSFFVKTSDSFEGIPILVDGKALPLLNFEAGDFPLKKKVLFLVPFNQDVKVGGELAYLKKIGYKPVENPVFYFTGFCKAVQNGEIIFEENSVHIIALGDGKDHLTLHVSTCHGGKKTVHTSSALGGKWLESSTDFFLCEKL